MEYPKSKVNSCLSNCIRSRFLGMYPVVIFFRLNDRGIFTPNSHTPCGFPGSSEPFSNDQDFPVPICAEADPDFNHRTINKRDGEAEPQACKTEMGGFVEGEEDAYR